MILVDMALPYFALGFFLAECYRRWCENKGNVRNDVIATGYTLIVLAWPVAILGTFIAMMLTRNQKEN